MKFLGTEVDIGRHDAGSLKNGVFAGNVSPSILYTALFLYQRFSLLTLCAN